MVPGQQLIGVQGSTALHYSTARHNPRFTHVSAINSGSQNAGFAPANS